MQSVADNLIPNIAGHCLTRFGTTGWPPDSLLLPSNASAPHNRHTVEDLIDQNMSAVLLSTVTKQPTNFRNTTRCPSMPIKLDVSFQTIILLLKCLCN